MSRSTNAASEGQAGCDRLGAELGYLLGYRKGLFSLNELMIGGASAWRLRNQAPVQQIFVIRFASRVGQTQDQELEESGCTQPFPLHSNTSTD
jgi:hypothetical protein